MFSWTPLVSVICAALGVSVAFSGDSCTQSGQELCVSPECVTTSNYILSMMDRTADPCTNMYQYSCGAWQKRVHIPEDASRWSTFTQATEGNTIKLRKLIESGGSLYKGVQSSAIKKLKDYFDTCMDTTTIEMRGRTPFIELIDKLGSWTVTSRYNKPWNKQAWNFQTAMERVLDVIGLKAAPPFLTANRPFINLAVMGNYANPNKTIAYILPSGLILRNVFIYALRGQSYLNASKAIAYYLGGNPSIAATKLQEVIKFETDLSTAVFRSIPSDPFPYNNFHKMKLSDAQKDLGSLLDLKKYLKSAFKGATFTDDTDVNVIMPKYFSEMKALVQNTSSEIVNNYIVHTALFDSLLAITTPATALPSKMHEAVFSLSSKLFGKAVDPPRWKACLEESEAVMGFASSALFDQDNFPQESRTRVSNLFQSMKREIIDDISSVSWLDKSTRDNLKVKARALGVQIGYPQWTSDPTTLDSHYQQYKVSRGKAFENYINNFKFSLIEQTERLKKPNDRTRFMFRPDFVNAFYSPNANTIFILSGIVQPPMFSPVFPEAYNYGSLGSTVGHEMTHGFDNKGRLFDAFGAVTNMWTKKSEQGFNNASKCLIDQYSAFKVTNKHLNGKLELSENIADNGGLKLAYKAMQKTNITENQLPGLNFTKEQLFFIGFGQKFCAEYRLNFELNVVLRDPHPPSNYRVLGTIANSRDFGKAFNCPAGTPMNPAQKCEVW